MNYYLKAFKNYATFNGRATRTDYWMFALINLIFGIIAMIIDHLLGTCFKLDLAMGTQTMLYGYVYAIYNLVVFIPGLALGVRRLHDVGKSGWFFLIVFLPLIGAIWLLVLFCTDSQAGENAYGPNPKELSPELS
jgi:uncharacterized membrane protein YhaH (DUF805 family)